MDKPFNCLDYISNKFNCQIKKAIYEIRRLTMKIRIMGTVEECNLAIRYYTALRADPIINYVEISGLYQNRGNSTLHRIYIEISYKI